MRHCPREATPAARRLCRPWHGCVAVLTSPSHPGLERSRLVLQTHCLNYPQHFWVEGGPPQVSSASWASSRTKGGSWDSLIWLSSRDTEELQDVDPGAYV